MGKIILHCGIKVHMNESSRLKGMFHWFKPTSPKQPATKAELVQLVRLVES